MTAGKQTKVSVAAKIAALLGATGMSIARDGSSSCGVKSRDSRRHSGDERVRTETGRAQMPNSRVTTNAEPTIVRRTNDLIVVIDPAPARHGIARNF